jgi:hypothetical protein
LLQDRGLERSQRRPRIHAQFVGQPLADQRAGADGLGMPTAAIQRQDSLGPQPFPERIRHDERIELAGDRLVAPAREVGVDAILDRAGVGLGETSGRGLEAHAGLNVGERLASPQSERLTQRARRGHRVAGTALQSRPLDERHESMLVDILVGDVEPIPGGYELEERCRVGGAEDLPHRRHPNLEHPPSAVDGQGRP